MAVYGYCRVSTTRQADEGESLVVQRRMIEGHAMMHGFSVGEFFIEEGTSGSIPIQERPLGAELFRKLAPGDIIIAAKLDRMFRSALDALKIVDLLKKKSVGLHLLDLGGDVNANGLSKLFLTIVAAFAEAERDRISERQLNAKAHAKAQGSYLGGAVPFGFTLVTGELVEEPWRSEAVAYLSTLNAQGMSLRKIAEALTERGWPISHVACKKLIKLELSDGTPSQG